MRSRKSGDDRISRSRRIAPEVTEAMFDWSGVRSPRTEARGGPVPDRQDCRNANRSALMVSASVVGIPCGKPLIHRLKAMQHLVSIRERAVTDECGPQELDCVTVGQLVKRDVRDRPGAGEHLAQDRRGRGPADPKPVKDGVRRPPSLERRQIPAECRDRSRITGAAHPRDLLHEVTVGAPRGRLVS